MKHQLLYLVGMATVAAIPLAHQSSAAYFFTFGDSYTMTSFNISGTQPSSSNPMGNPNLGTGTTGGGVNWVGDLTTEDNCSLVLSYNLAIGGATIDNRIINATVEDMTTQVASFHSIYGKKPHVAPWRTGNTVFGFWIGINDIGRAYANYDASVLVPKLMAQYESLVREIYADGGRKFLFLNAPPTSRSPFILAEGAQASEAHAAWVTAYNDGLDTMVERFRRKHSDVKTVVYDTWSFMTNILDYPEEYGYPDSTCINDDGISCIWWNNYHPGLKYHRLQATNMKQYLEPFGAW
ncbi:hypothetical protein N7476_008274 [Penicillium atrosanguineum]|uniref:Uncharacterized protein n=1 Tax=Penicillium atrosanguineum TaxID=1132637 RepID=A0A9W9PRI2_9EURO|nr:hypothetical protein N7526_003893 [Penicillium atrosanguineum]KAJ5307618.1 hypothetical protein N7476_008274 [Penicillium atrosanguineum]